MENTQATHSMTSTDQQQAHQYRLLLSTDTNPTGCSSLSNQCTAAVQNTSTADFRHNQGKYSQQLLGHASYCPVQEQTLHYQTTAATINILYHTHCISALSNILQ